MNIHLPRSAKGKRPKFFAAEPAADRLLTMVMSLAGEVSVLRERLDTIECLATDKGLMTAAEIEAYEPSIADQERREAWRQNFLDRLFQVLTDEVNEAAPAAGPPPGTG